MSSFETTSRHIAVRLHEDAAHLRSVWNTRPKEYARHFVVDNLLTDELAREISVSFPKEGSFWRTLNSFRECKKTFAKLDELDPIIANITDAFQQRPVLDAIENITGISELEADASLYAGGISLMTKGDFLNPHIDNSHDAIHRRYRRINLLYYVSPNWSAKHGGNFELWDHRITSPLEIVSNFNRLVVMETNKTSWHSVNPVLADVQRCCISNYYFSTNPPGGDHYHHVTSFLGRPDQYWRRMAGRIDNMLRQIIASTLGITRGNHLRRNS